MVIKDMKDIDKVRHEKMKDEVSEYMVDIFEKTADGIGDYFKRKDIRRQEIERKRGQPKPSLLVKILKLIGWVCLIIFVLNIFLGNVWLLKTIVKSLFNI